MKNLYNISVKRVSHYKIKEKKINFTKKDEMDSPKVILSKFWNYDSFRPLQEEIIDSVLKGRDTLAILPTGGGKSICFQVPALIMDGMCLVVSPLISLMKDQTETLKKKGIKALAIYSGMTRDEM